MINPAFHLSISGLARALSISRGTVYYLPAPTPQGQLDLMKAMARLLHLGYEVERLHVRTLMQRMGLRAMCPQPGSATSRPAPGHIIYPYLLRGMAIERADQVWVLDTTYILRARGFVYLMAVIDVASRKVLAHKVATSLQACHAKEVISQAFRRFGVPQIVNTDQDSQVTAAEFTQAVLKRGCQLSMDGCGAWRDNVFMQRVWRTLKYEHVYNHIYANVQEAGEQVGKCLRWYNMARTHSSLSDQTLDEAYGALLPGQERKAV